MSADLLVIMSNEILIDYLLLLKNIITLYINMFSPLQWKLQRQRPYLATSIDMQLYNNEYSKILSQLVLDLLER